MIIALDQGTTGTTAILMNEKAELIERFSVKTPIRFPRPGWVEQNPEEIRRCAESAISGLLKKSKLSSKRVMALGITNQRETVSLFDGKKALYPFIVWQDRRSSKICESHKKQAALIHRKTSTPIDPYFSSTKIEWILKNNKIAKKNKNIRFRTIDSFLLHSFSGEDVIEISNASRTQLLGIKSLRWDEDLFEIFGIPKSFAPQIIASECSLKTKGMRSLPDGIPICAVLGDQQAALFGQLGFQKNHGKITFGTGSFILLNTGETPIFSKNSLVGTVALQWANGKTLYALEGSAFVCGAWIDWLKDNLKIFERSSDSENLSKKVKGSDGVFVVPALTGLGAPFWKAERRGSIHGLSRGVTREHVARASLEALSFQNKALISAMKKDLKTKKKMNWKVDKKMVENALLLQIQSNILNEKIVRPKNLEATATGVALLAGKSIGLFDLPQIKKSWKARDEFHPKEVKRYDRLYQDWLKFL